MKRLPQSKNSNTNGEIPPVPKNRKRSRKNNESSEGINHLVLDAQNAQSSTSSGVDRENSAAESNLTTITSGNSYNLRSKNPPLLPSDDEDDNATPKRMQQPPAYVNPNLMKVKIEEDYVPIVTPKKEPAEFEMGQEENQQQEQQENETVQVKVEADADLNDASTLSDPVVNENEIEKQKDELIAKQKDKIKKYSERISSLVLEKTEIKMALDKEIAQLNLANEELKTEIEDLSSTTTLQRDENGRLNAQLLQQKHEIEELTRKLKLLDENQQTAGQVENLDLEPKSNQIEIGVLPAKVMSNVFDYLDLKSLKKSRFVCRQWRNEAGKILVGKFYLVCDGKKRCEKTLLNWLRNFYLIPTSSSTAPSATPQKLWSKGKQAELALQLLTKFPSLRRSVTQLKLEEPDTDNLFAILNLLTNLEVLETGKLDFPVESTMLIQKLAKIKKLKLDFWMGVARHLFSHHEQFASVKSMEIRVCGMNFMQSYIKKNLYHSYSISQWSITRLTLNVQGNSSVGVIRSFLQRISQSLQHLKFLGKPIPNHSSLPLEPWKDDWLIPLELRKLETLEIDPLSLEGNGNVFVITSICVALNFPRLKKLTLYSIPEELQEIIHQWNSHESARANGWTLSSESLEELELVAGNCSMKIPGNPWTRLKSVKCSINPECFSVSIFSELKNLERLELYISSTVWCWNANFHGNAKDEMTEYNRNSSSKFHLKDLKDLKSICLQFWRNDQHHQDFANHLVETELKLMPSLQLVQFYGVLIDEGHLKSLKSVLGPNVPIIFTK